MSTISASSHNAQVASIQTYHNASGFVPSIFILPFSLVKNIGKKQLPHHAILERKCDDALLSIYACYCLVVNLSLVEQQTCVARPNVDISLIGCSYNIVLTIRKSQIRQLLGKR